MRRTLHVLIVLTLTAAAVPVTEAAGVLDVTLVAPSALVRGETATFSGTVSFAERGVPLLDVDLLEDGIVVARTTTSTAGRFGFSVAHIERGFHFYQVFARAPGSAESTSPIVRVSWAVAPSAPGIPALAQAEDARTFDATWAAPGDGGGAPVSHRRLYIAPGAEGPWTLLATPPARALHLASLSWDTPYALHARDVNIAGEGARSDILSFRTPVAEPPTAPLNLAAAFDNTTGQVTLTWDVPAQAGNGAAQGLLMDKSRNGGAYGPDTQLGSDTRAYTFPVSWGSTYDLRLRAKSTAGIGEASVVTIEIPIREGLTLDIPRASICQEWPSHLLCTSVHDGQTLTIYTATTKLAPFLEGYLFEANAPLVAETVGLESDILYGGVSQTRSHSVRTDVHGRWYTEPPAFTVPQLAAGACQTYTTATTGTANGWTRADTITFTLCSSGAPPT